jgi:hypothetical protein
MTVAGMSKTAQAVIKSPATRKRAANKARALCKVVARPGDAGLRAAADQWTNGYNEFVAGVNPALPPQARQKWDILHFVDIAARTYANAFCPAQKARLQQAYDLSQKPPLTQPVSDVDAYVRVYGDAVVSLSCGDQYGTGIVIPVRASATAVNAGMKSGIVTSRYVLEECTEGEFLDRRVKVRTSAGEYPGYVWSWADDKDVALVFTVADIVSVKNFIGSEVANPEFGDTAVLIWGQSGLAGRAEAARVVQTASDYIRTTHTGPDEYLAGAAVFNTRGELLGMVDSSFVDSSDSTMAVLPITRFCDGPYSTDCYIGWDLDAR